MTLLSPTALWTLAALALPLAIHLWRRPARTVRLGSLRFLQERPRRWQNLRWREHALLFVRLGLLATLAFLLARPVWQTPPSSRPQRRVLLDPAAAPDGPSLERLRALQSSGFETRLLAPGFPAMRTPPADPTAPAPDLWSLLREADATLPAGSSLAVFSPGRLASLHGVRPALARCRVEWIDTPAAAPAASPLPTPVPSLPPLTVLILHDADRAADARYVAAACRALSQTDHRPLTVSVALTTAPASAADWIFWLGAQAPPPGVSALTTHLLDDAATTADSDTESGWVVPQPGTAAPTSPVHLWRRAPPTVGSVIWTDGFGQPLLTRTGNSHGTHWHFASRFDPAWNDLPLGSALPASLRTLLATADTPGNPDFRLADPSQCLPSDALAPAGSKIAFTNPAIDLRPPLWLLAAFLFCLERLLSHRRSLSPALTVPVPGVEPALSR